MLSLPAIRWGQPYESLDVDSVVHFLTGEPVARVSQVNAGIVRRDARHGRRARGVLLDLSPRELMAICKKAGKLFLEADLPLGDTTQSPEEFVLAQSATSGLPLNMCRANMKKNAFVLENMQEMINALTRGLDLEILARGYGEEARGVTLSYQAQSPVLGAVLPSNSPGVHTLWLPAVAMQIGLLLKPGSQEPWTPYRLTAALVAAGLPAEAIAIYPGAGAEIGSSVLESSDRSMIFGGPDTITRYAGNPRVQVHGPGYSKILLGDDRVDRWEDFLDLMVDSVFANGGRSCINCSAIYASRHTKEISSAIAERIGPVEVKLPEDPDCSLAAFTVPSAASAIWQALENDLDGGGVKHMTASHGDRLVERERCGYLRPVVAHCDSPDCAIASKEYMFPMVSVVECPQEKMLESIGSTLIGTAITADKPFQRELLDSTDIDRLNLGPIATHHINWLQPHEGNLVEFLFRNRAVQVAEEF